jgi:carbonic anhydrase
MKASAVILSLASTAAAICHHGTSLFTRADGPAFGYHELQGPLNWHGLSTTNELCAVGQNQSPINVVQGENTVIAGSSFALSIPNSNHNTFINLGTTVEVIASGTAKIGTKSYSLRQFHFHTPSEHHFNGEYYPAEVHFVFQAADSTLMVIGFFIEVAAGEGTNPLLQAVLSKVSQIPNGQDETTTGALDFTSIRTHLNRSNVHRYAGSLTTPPCDQGVTFNVVEAPLYISAIRYRELKDVVKFNSRYTQNKPGQINLLENAANTIA